MRAFAACLAVLLVAGCSHGGSGAPSAGPSPAPTPTSSCPTPPVRHFAWPSPVPADLPQPPGAVLEATEKRGDVFVVRFSSAVALRQGVLFLLHDVQAAGYTLGRGDAEPAEADVPFGRTGLSGIYKLRVVTDCSTDWLVAVSRGFGPPAPFLRTPTHGPSASPLPFG